MLFSHAQYAKLVLIFYLQDTIDDNIAGETGESDAIKNLILKKKNVV